jgi:hypothetical protein
MNDATRLAVTTIIRPDGTGESRTWDASKSPPLEFLQEAVGGFVERVHTAIGLGGIGDVVVFVNEDGLMLELPHNQAATFLLQRPIVGPIVVCEDFDPEAWTR